jgi:tetratricopeptide (TPR) repeat protein
MANCFEMNTQSSPIAKTKTELELFEGPYDDLEQEWRISKFEKEYETVCKYTWRAAAYFNLTMPEEALKELDRAPAELQENHRVLGIRARTYALMGKETEFREMLSRYLASIRRNLEENSEQVGAHIHFTQHLRILGWTLDKEVGRKAALAVFQGGIWVAPEDATLWFELAKALHFLLQPEEARSALKTCLELDPIFNRCTLSYPENDRLKSLIMDRKAPIQDDGSN